MLKANSEAAAAFAAQTYGQQLQDPAMWTAQDVSPNTAAKAAAANGNRSLSLQERLQEDFPSGVLDGVVGNNSNGSSASAAAANGTAARVLPFVFLAL